MSEKSQNEPGLQIKTPPFGLAILAMIGPSFVWTAEYIGSGEVILATRTGAILGAGVLWAIVFGIFLKYWIGMSGARYTVCTGEGMVDMFDRMPGPRHWIVWIVLLAQFITAAFSIGSIATTAGVFIHSLIPVNPVIAGWVVTLFAVAAVWSGVFDVLKIIMSFFVVIIVLGVLYVAVHVFPGFSELLQSLYPSVPQVPEWALKVDGINNNPWEQILPLIGWGAGGFASQVWYTYWVLGAGYGAAAGRNYGQPADVTSLRNMSRQAAEKIKGWCHVLYADASLAMVIGIVVTSSFFIAGAGILGPEKIAPSKEQVAIELSNLFSLRWGHFGGILFLIAGAAAIISTQVGQLAGWPRLLADSFRICVPGFHKIKWKTQFRLFLVFFIFTNMIIVFSFKKDPTLLVQFSSLLDGLLLTPLQAICVAVGLFWVLPRLLSKEAFAILRPSRIFAVVLFIAFLVFSYFCIFQMPLVLLKIATGLRDML